MLHGLGAADMKGPVAACIVAARALPAAVPATLLFTSDEETTKAGARAIVERSALVRTARPAAILIAEPSSMVPVRGHRSSINFTATATGVQAHSSTGRGRNANWDLAPFVMAMRAIHQRLRTDPALHDAAYDPPFCDFNLVIDNFGAPVNTTVPKATARIKFRRSARIDAEAIIAEISAAAAVAGVELAITREGPPPELPADHALIRLCAAMTGTEAATAPFGTDASELQALARCVILGPGDIADAHTPTEKIRLATLAAAVPLFVRLAQRIAGGL
jgi:acetylornithine deacetylase